MIETALIYSSPLLTLLFVGFCATIIVAQLVPAILMLIGVGKALKPDRQKAYNKI